MDRSRRRLPATWRAPRGRRAVGTRRGSVIGSETNGAHDARFGSTADRHRGSRGKRRGTQRVDHRPQVRRVCIQRLAGDQHLAARGVRRTDRLEVDARRPRRSAGRGRAPRPPGAGARILGSTSVMNAWPPQPGLTVMTSSRSIRSRNGRTASAGVSGLSGQAGLPAVAADRGDHLARVVVRLDVEDDEVAPRFGEGLDVLAAVRLTIRWLWIRHLEYGPHRLDHHRPDGEVARRSGRP